MVTLTLANPLTAAQADRLHAKGSSKDYRQGDKITLPRDDARLLINAGYAAGVDPADHEAVHKALDAAAASSKSSGKASG
jgi:hypothetical protein